MTFRSLFGMTPTEYYCLNNPGQQPYRKWTREEALNAIDRYVARTNKLPAVELRSANGLPSEGTVARLTGGTLMSLYEKRYPELYAARKEANKDVNKVWSKESIIGAIEGFIQRNGRLPVNADFNEANKLPSTNTVKIYFGRPAVRLMKERYPDMFVPQKFIWTTEKAHKAIDGFIRQNGRIPKSTEYTKANGLPTYPNAARLIGRSPAEYCREQYPDLAPPKRQGQDEEPEIESGGICFSM